MLVGCGVRSNVISGLAVSVHLRAQGNEQISSELIRSLMSRYGSAPLALLKYHGGAL